MHLLMSQSNDQTPADGTEESTQYYRWLNHLRGRGVVGQGWRGMKWSTMVVSIDVSYGRVSGVPDFVF